MSVVWKDPPRYSDKRTVWPERLDPLKQSPGDWAVVYTAPSDASARVTLSRLNNGKVVLPEGQFEFDRDGCDIYARYLGSEVATGKVKGLPLTAPTQSARSDYERSTSSHP